MSEQEAAKKTEQNSEKQRFQIKDEQSLQWTFQKAEQKRQEARGYQKMMQEAIDFYQSKIDSCYEDIENFNQIIRQYADEKLNEDPNWEYTNSPFGRIVLSKPKPQLKPNKERLIEKYIGTDFVKQEFKLDWAKLQCSLTTVNGHVVNDDGEIIKDIKVVEKPAQIEIKHKNANGRWAIKEG